MINQHLRTARKAKRWSMQVACERVGVDRVTYSRWERGEQNPHLSTLDLLCHAFEMSPEALGFEYLLAKPTQMEPACLVEQPPIREDIPPALQGVILPFPSGRRARSRSFEEVYA